MQPSHASPSSSLIDNSLTAAAAAAAIWDGERLGKMLAPLQKMCLKSIASLIS